MVRSAKYLSISDPITHICQSIDAINTLSGSVCTECCNALNQPHLHWNVSQIVWKIPFFRSSKCLLTCWCWTLIDFCKRWKTKNSVKRCVGVWISPQRQILYMEQSNKDHRIDNDSNGYQQQLTAPQPRCCSLFNVLNMYAHSHTRTHSQQVFLSKDLLKWRKREFRSSMRVLCMWLCTHSKRFIQRTNTQISMHTIVSERV